MCEHNLSAADVASVKHFQRVSLAAHVADLSAVKYVFMKMIIFIFNNACTLRSSRFFWRLWLVREVGASKAFHAPNFLR